MCTEGKTCGREPGSQDPTIDVMLDKKEGVAVRAAGGGARSAGGKLGCEGTGGRTNGGLGARIRGIVRPAWAAEDSPVAGFTGDM